MKIRECPVCGITYGLPNDFIDSREDGRTKTGWYCPNGHYLEFVDSPAEKLRRERDLLKQNQARLEEQIKKERNWREMAERSASAYKGQATRLRNRAKAGMCPCCRRTFQNLARHMKTKHPDFQSEPDRPNLEVIEGSK